MSGGMLLGIIFIALASCDFNNERPTEPEGLSSANPLITNARTRRQKYEAGNLIINPSFESGRIRQIDSLTQSIQIDGWEFVGREVRWLKSPIDQERGEHEQIHTGQRSVKITRSNASETEDMGAGAISDFIRVIPGNYSLTVYLNLQDISNPKSRLGTALYDAVDIRLIYYDRNKLQIDPRKHSPYHGNFYNNSFKGLSLSRFCHIDSTGWIRVHGRSHLLPVPDGDLQDDTRFVRVFIGLKGNGEMYLDDVSLTYTPWNLTAKEKLTPFFDSTFVPGQLIVPQPRSVKIMESIIYYKPYYRDDYPLILISEDADPLTLRGGRKLERLIRQQIAARTGQSDEDIPNLLRDNITESERKKRIIFSLGNNRLFNEFKDRLPLDSISGEAEGYMIWSLDEIPGAVFLYGNSDAANWYAVQSASQLLDNSRMLFHNAHVIDYPARDTRPLLLLHPDETDISALPLHESNRFNAIYLPAGSDRLLEQLSVLSQLKMVEAGIYFEPEYSQKEDQVMLNYSIPDLSQLTDVSHAIVFLDPLEASEKYEITDEGNLPELIEYLSGRNIKISLVPSSGVQDICGPCSTKGMELPEDITFIFDAQGLLTWKVDEADIMSFEKGYGELSTFLDLSFFARSEESGYFFMDPLWPGKLPLASLMEPFGNEILPEVYHRADVIITGGSVRDVFERLRIQTASDFAWNPDNYNPDLSIYRALVSEFGPAATRNILQFNDLYFKMRSEIILAGNPKTAARHLRRASTLSAEMQSVVDSLDHAVSGSKYNLNDRIDALYDKLEEERIRLSNSALKSE